MANSLALRRATASSLFNRLVNAVRSASVFRSFNANTQMKAYRRSHRSVSRRRDDFPSFSSDVVDTSSPPGSVSQLLNVIHQMMDSSSGSDFGMMDSSSGSDFGSD